MTLPEFLGSIGALLGAIACPVVAGVLGYGVLVILAAIPVGFIVGWLLGVAMTYPVMALEPRPPKKPRTRDDAPRAESGDALTDAGRSRSDPG
jgi:hypothetical protein